MPFTQRELATYPTRWVSRGPPADMGRLHLLIGPAAPSGIQVLFDWLRATPAGRPLLANGAGVYGLKTAAEGAAWLVAYRGFLADPTALPPAGDYPVPTERRRRRAPAGRRGPR